MSDEKDPLIPIVPTFTPSGEVRPVNGFGVLTSSDGIVVLQPFFDMPPVPENFNDPAHTKVNINRVIWATYTLSPTNVRFLCDSLNGALRDLTKMADKKDEENG